jgi:glycerol-3-phosphate O-acyltransferase
VRVAKDLSRADLATFERVPDAHCASLLVTIPLSMQTYALIAAAAVVLIFLVSVLLRRYAFALMRERNIKLERFKLKSRHTAIAQQVFASAEVQAAMQQYASENQVSIEAAQRQARIYLFEIVPKFNLLAYYRVGHPIARAVLNFLYRVVVERNTIRRFNDRTSEAVVVYVINHRSNVDYVLVAHMLFKFISLSYAVGEWARVWPLNHLFKWFGGYFVRRRYREPLYHAVLAGFVRTITRNGVTQGVFLEGGLSRDGAFQKPKLGMLDYLVTSKRDRSFTTPLYFVPTSVNYDRVLEDRNLTEELIGKEDRSSRIDKLSTTIEFLFKNVGRSIVGRFKRYGYAVVSFGEPLLIDEVIARHPELLHDDFEERKPALQILADQIMSAISESLPLTPVTMVATLFSRNAGQPLNNAKILEGIDALRVEWGERVLLIREHTADEIWRSARLVLELRRLIELTAAGWIWNGDEELLLRYYANALIPYEQIKARGWPERKRSDGFQPSS